MQIDKTIEEVSTGTISKQELKTWLKMLEVEIGRSAANYNHRRASLMGIIFRKQKILNDLTKEWSELNEQYQARLEKLKALLRESQ